MSPSHLLRRKIETKRHRPTQGRLWQVQVAPLLQDGYHLWIRTVEQLKALADPLRIRLIQELMQGPSTVTELAIQFEMDIGGLSHHLGVLFRVGLVDRARQGRFVEYRVAAPFELVEGRPMRLKLDRMFVEFETAPTGHSP